MARPISRPHSTTRADLHLGSLRRLVRALAKSTVKISGPLPEADAPHHVSTLIVALLNLAKRNLRPACLEQGKGGGMILFELCSSLLNRGNPAPARESNAGVRDTSAFASACCKLLTPLASLDEATCRALAKALADHSTTELLEVTASSALSTGWTREFLKQEAPNPTQFFTPAWIADILAQQAIEGNLRKDLKEVTWDDFRLLDPACGAGHLLVPAFTMLFDIDTKEASDSSERIKTLQNLLDHKVYGLDVDETLIELARFALYLTARDIEDSPGALSDLPIPKLFALTAPLGTLALAIAKNDDPATRLQLPVELPVELPKDFDAIVMNPPYLSTRTMDDTTRYFLRDHFSSASGDLYTAFIELGMRLLKESGRMSTVVQQSFLSISRYRKLRLSLLEEHNLLSAVILGTGAFPSRPGEKVNNAIITVQKRPHSSAKALALSFHRLADEKKLTLTQEEARDLVAQITGQPFAFHCSPHLAKIFKDHPAMADENLAFDLTNGLFTCNNERFVKEAAYVEALADQSERERFVPYDKGGGQKWFHQTAHRLDWGSNGESIRAYRLERGQSRSLPGEQFYFQPGVTYSYIGTKGFKARLLSEGAVFDIASSAIFSRRFDLHYLLGFLNSALAAYLLSLLNPTVNFQIGDLRKLPFKAPDTSLESEVAALAAQAVNLVRLEGGRAIGLAAIQSRIDELIFDHYRVASAIRAEVYADPWVGR